MRLTFICSLSPSPSPSYLFHLSNSSYAKTLDYSRGALHFAHFYRFLSEGGRLFLGGSSFHFHKEIPIMAKYEVQMRLASWDDKWICEWLSGSA